MRRIIIALAGLLGSSVLGLALATMPASAGTARPADTPECASAVYTHGGVTANYCASQELVPLKLELAAPNKAVAYAQLTVKAASTTNASEDFEFYHPATAAGNNKLIELAPRGNPSGLCAAVSNNGRNLVLKFCNGSSEAQQFAAMGPDPTGGYTWDSALTGNAITDPGGGPAYTRLILSPDADQPGQSFTFEQ